MSIGQLRNQMVGEPTRVPGYAEGYGQAPGQARPSMPAQPNPIGRPTLVVGGPSYYVPPGYQAPPQPTEAFLPTDVRPDPIGQQFMRQLESPMGQQFQQQYEATQAPLRQAEQERQQAELARRDERFQELMDRIAQLEGQLGAQEEAPVMPNIPTFPIGDGFEIDFSQIPNFGNFLNFGNQMEPVEREDYQDLMSEIDNLPSSPPPPPPPVVSAPVVEEEPVFTRALPTDFEEKLREQELRISEPITQLEPYEREDYQELVSQIPTPPPPPPVVPKMPSIPQITPTQTLANIGYDEADIEEILERQQTRPSRFFEPASVMPTAPIPTPVVPTNLPKINIPQMQKFVPPPVPQAVGSPLIRGNINNIPTFDLPTMVPRSIIGKLNKGPGI